jgi:hypothetical protein
VVGEVAEDRGLSARRETSTSSRTASNLLADGLVLPGVGSAA